MRFCENVCTAWLKHAAMMALFAGALAAARPVAAASIYIDFGTLTLAPSNLFAAAAGEAGAWNNVALGGTTPGLLDIFGNPTGAAITVTVSSMGGTGGPGSSDAARLMHDNFFTTNGGAWEVSLSGLTDGLYDLYLYDASNLAVGTGGGTANGVAFTNVNGSFSGAFTPDVNYQLLSSVLVTGGLLAATGAEAGAAAGLAGLQLVERQTAPTPVAEPPMLILLGAGLLPIAVRARRVGVYGSDLVSCTFVLWKQDKRARNKI